MIGTMLVQTAVSFGSAATLNGRALVRDDAVTLLANTVSIPLAGGGGDPVFYAFHSGNKYHWQGAANKVAALVSDAHLQVRISVFANSFGLTYFSSTPS